MKFTYLWVNFLTVIIPLAFSFHPKIKFNLYFKSFLTANIPVALIFILWDVLFTKIGVWGFNPDYISGLYVLDLPIEELLFFTCIPFSCVFTYFSLNKLYHIHLNNKTESIIIMALISMLLLVGILYFSRLYTSVTFLSLALILLVFRYVLKVDWLSKFIVAYLILLFPFLIVNGILTGTGLDSPVVWYNNSENIGIRILTIPVEDVFYGMELILLNVFLFEYFKRNIYLSENAQGHTN